MSNFVKVTIIVLLALIFGAIFAVGINTYNLIDKRLRAVGEKIDKVVENTGKTVENTDPQRPQFNIVHGYYHDPENPPKKGEQPFRAVRIDKEGYLVVKRKR